MVEMMPGDAAVMNRSEKACSSSAMRLKPSVSSVIGLRSRYLMSACASGAPCWLFGGLGNRRIR